MFDKIRQIIKDKYGDKADLYEPQPDQNVWDKESLQVPEEKQWISPFVDGTLKMPKSKRPAVGKSGKSNRKRLSTNAKLKRRRAT